MNLELRVIPHAKLGRHVHKNYKSENLPYWPVLDQDEHSAAMVWGLKTSRQEFWTKILPHSIQKVMGAEKNLEEQ
jgi:hypothetical protein